VTDGAEPEPAPLIAEELIDDRALTAAGDDAFRLADFVTELVDLCEETSLPANIALFGPWGSGKSSLANLLEAEFKLKSGQTVSFARFNAFKYAEVPLRRHFLSQVAKAFKIDDKKYGEELYKETKTNTYSIPPRELSKFLLLVAAVTGVVLALLVLVAVIVAATSKGPFSSAFSGAIRHGIPAAIIGSGLLSAFLGLAGQTFTNVSTRQAPSTEEEFERLFKLLVRDIQKETKCERIVIFIDELDRCSPREVVTALETIRTFLDIQPCVFIVAADQQAVEHALKKRARQATPVDPANPYYSAGSAYLDKIFQYQLALPPLLPRTLSQFALSLVQNRAGIWQRIENMPELITVLVPGHVRSPRRVKVLLNSFVLAYRLSLMRSSEGALDAGVETRSSEMAKLVCLRTEFPLFAADLRIDARMPQATLALYRQPDLTLTDLNFAGFSEEAFARAAAYAAGLLPLDEMIARRPEGAPESKVDDPNVTPVKEEEDEAAGAADATPGQEDGDGDDSEDDQDAALADPVDINKSQARQLIAYLQRTEEIPGPGRDLVFLESSGAAVGLAPELADELERNALNGATEAVVDSITRLEQADQEAAYHLLCHLVRERIGLEGHNARRCLLVAVQVSKGTLDPIVDDVLTTLRAATSGYSLTSGDLPGALELSLLRNSEPAIDLRRQVLSREETRSDEALGLLIISRSKKLNVDERKLLGPVLAARLLATDPEPLFKALDGLDDSTIADLVASHEEEIRAGLNPEEAAGRLAGLADYASSHRSVLAPSFMRLLLSLDTQDARNAAGPLLPRLAPISDGGLIGAILTSVAPRRISRWGQWLEPLDPKSVTALEDVPSLISVLAARVLAARFSTENAASDEDAARAIQLLSRILPKGAVIPTDEVEATFQRLAPGPVVNSDQVDARLTLHNVTHSLAENRLLAPDFAAHLVLADVNASLSQPITLTPTTERLPAYVFASINLTFAAASATDIEATIEAVRGSTWLVQAHKDVLVTYGLALQRTLGGEVTESVAVEDLAPLLAIGRDAEPAFVAWIRAFKPAPDSIRQVFGDFSRERELASSVQAAIGSLAAGWTEDERRQLFKESAQGFVADQFGLALLTSTGLEDIDPSFAASELSRIFDDTNNNSERERVMQVWRRMNLTGDGARRILVDRIYIPLVRQGRGAAKIALDYFDLVQTAPSAAAQKRIRVAINDEVKGDDALKRRANQLLRDAGWIRRGLFG
jgi:hypothetical protein